MCQVEDEFIVIATDGVWEFITPEEAVALVAKQKDPKESCQALVDLAYQRWIEEEEGIVDDITCVVVFLATSGSNRRSIDIAKSGT